MSIPQSTDQYVEVGILIQIADGIDGEPHTVFADWNEVRYTLPPGTKLYARVPADDVPAEPKPCEHLRSELLGETQKDDEPLFQLRMCMDCGKSFHVRTSVTRP
jgi:hypothetical protein